MQLWSIGDSLPSKRAHESPLRRLEFVAALRAEYGVEVLYERSRVALALLEAIHGGCLVQHLKSDADTSHYAFNGPTQTWHDSEIRSFFGTTETMSRLVHVLQSK